MTIVSMKKLGLTRVVAGGLLAAVLGFAAPAQADLDQNIWANMQNQHHTTTSAPQADSDGQH